MFDIKPLLRAAFPPPFHTTPWGALFADDCLRVLNALEDRTVDTVFADPPFNLGKKYGRKTDDLLPKDDYLHWCRRWLAQCVRVLKPGGSLFVYNLPRWNIPLGTFLTEQELDFRHWIAIEMSAGLPITGRLHPSHYGLLYYTKGRPKTFHRIRTAVETCRHCRGEVRDYGGHRGALSPNGVTLKDVWTDIAPVRHQRFKSGARWANALSTRILERVVDMSTEPGDLVLDPFGGSGTTFAVCEARGRRWIGAEIEIASARDIVERLERGDVRPHPSSDYREP